MTPVSQRTRSTGHGLGHVDQAQRLIPTTSSYLEMQHAMKLNAIQHPVKNELAEVKKELMELLGTFDFQTTEDIVAYFSKIPGKFLRPTLLLLSAKAVQDKPSEATLDALVKTALGVELIHNASLIHDDILDADMERRGQPTVNAVWGNKISLLAGDVVYSRAFGILSGVLPLDLLQRVVRLNETMCGAEIEQSNKIGKNLTKSEYFKIIEGKTGTFMELSCQLGASLSGGDNKEVQSLADFGLALGLAYQLYDDNADGDLACEEVDGLHEGRYYAEKAMVALNELRPTVARERLMDLARHLIAVHANKI